MALWRNRPWLLRASALVAAAIVVVLVQWLAPRTLGGVEAFTGDMAWRVGASSQPERRLVVVDIDEASLRDVGPWPWPRATMAELAQKLAKAGALVQAYDIAFTDAKAGDDELQKAWAQTAVVAGQVFSIDPSVTPVAGVVSGHLGMAGCPPFAPVSHGHYGSSEALLPAHPAVGHLTPRIEADGVVRKLPALVCHQGRAYPSLALATLWRAAQPESGAAEGAARGLPLPDWEWHIASDHRLVSGLLAPAAWLTSRSLPGLVIPLDAQGDLRVPYALDRKAFASVSASDVLKDRADTAMLKGAVVLVGATAFGIGDTVATPHGAVASGLEVHAQALVGLLDHRLPYTPTTWPALQWVAMLVVATTLHLVARQGRGAPAKRLPLTGLALAAVCIAGAVVGLLRFDLWLPWASTALFAMLASVMLATAEHALTRAQRERLSAHLGSYLPAPVAQRLMKSDPSGSLQVEQRDVTVLVADIRNFSAFATHRPAEETAIMLHSFCCIAVDVVEQFGGVVENVVGDSVLAVWNAYSDCPDHPKQAMAAAQELVRATRQLLASGPPITESSPVQPLALGVGLESGSAIVGSFGPARRRAHAALGEPVSVANRIQQMTADLSMPILVGPTLAAGLPAEGVEPQGEYLLEGLSKHYRLFAPVGWSDLVSIDPNWAASAAAGADRQNDSTEWSRWADNASSGTTVAGPLRAVGSIQLRDA
ncbi:CHASE2 domain-containing protein [Ideonella sp. A 288]|uniref:CHASE2 domain-containing protein n=1 Tax=Ideonella sp. A 288 TaxID=1962181 RepID=UPI000B4BDF9F|nr:adenylate/guanylate cyclase domain-containing protein [Ideonella sp. A 288]